MVFDAIVSFDDKPSMFIAKYSLVVRSEMWGKGSGINAVDVSCGIFQDLKPLEESHVNMCASDSGPLDILVIHHSHHVLLPTCGFDFNQNFNSNKVCIDSSAVVTQ